MWYRFGANVVVSTAFAVILALSVVNSASAEGTSPLSSDDPAQLVADFLAMPDRLLSTHPDGGDAMAAQVRLLVLTDPSTLDEILALLERPEITDDQKDAIGKGLGSAVAALAAIDPDDPAIERIRTALDNAGDETALTAYLDAIGEEATAAVTTGGAGGAGGQTGGIGTGGTGVGTAFDSTGTSGNSSFSLTGGGGNSSRNTTTTAGSAGSTSLSTF